MSSLHDRAIELLSKLKQAQDEVNAFVVANEVPIREVTCIFLPPTPSVYSTSVGHALVLQIYADTLAHNLGEPEPAKLPA